MTVKELTAIEDGSLIPAPDRLYLLGDELGIPREIMLALGRAASAENPDLRRNRFRRYS